MNTRAKRIELTKELLKVQQRRRCAINVTEQKQAIEQESRLKDAIRRLGERRT